MTNIDPGLVFVVHADVGVRCGWEVLDTLGPVRVEILLVSPPTPTVTIRTPTSEVPHTATTKARMRATFNPALIPCTQAQAKFVILLATDSAFGITFGKVLVRNTSKTDRFA